MRLLSRKDGILCLSPNQPPTSPYAILSHTWGSEEQEISFQDVVEGKLDKTGYAKVKFCLDQAEKDGFTFVWIDSCCIDRRDKSELGEAINKMFEYYAKSAICYVYLTDNPGVEISKSRWFTRGWTLQELLAPRMIEFYDCQGQFLGNRDSLRGQIKAATSIDIGMVTSLAKRFEWSLSRRTTKPEDKSYCVVALLEVTLIPNYGEGQERAQERLLDEVVKEHGRRTGSHLRAILAQHQAQIDRPHLGVQFDSRVQLDSLQDLRDRLLVSLYYDSMNLRRSTIANPFPGTCSWLLDNHDYCRWNSMSGPRFLWIKGKPGAGKSVLMNYAVKSTPRNGSRITFFFNARGNLIDRSTDGMYRALLYQLLSEAPDLVRALSGFPRIDVVSIMRDTRTALYDALRACQQPVQCFIDALDECALDEVQDMIYFLHDLTLTSKHLAVCFASRLYPALTVRNSVELPLDRSEHTHDLKEYVNGRLDVPDDPHGRTLVSQVIEKARGIFFWALVVVELLNKELRSGNVIVVQKTLDTLPSELSELLQEIILSEPVSGRFRICLQWLVFSGRPLSAVELYYAVWATLHNARLASNVFRTAYDPDILTNSHLERFVIDASRGLAEVVHRGEVQFIHESIKDYLLKNEGLRILHHSSDLVSSVHQELKHACETYLSIHDADVGYKSLSSHPLSEYAGDYLLHHSNEAAAAIPQDAFLQRLDTTLEGLYTLQSQRPPGIVPNRLASYCELNLLQLVTSYDAVRLIPMAKNISTGFRAGAMPPLIMAITAGSPATVDALLRSGVSVDEDWVGMPVLHLSCHSTSICDLLLQHGADPEVRDVHGRTPLSYASETGQIDCLEILFKAGARLDVLDGMGRTALVQSCYHRQQGAAIRLLQLGADPNVVDDWDQTPLMLASGEFGDIILVQYLLLHGASTLMEDLDGMTALDCAIAYGHKDICKVLR